MQQNRSFLFSVLRIVWVILALQSVAFGQITNVTDDQTTPIPGTGHDYIGMVNETVDPANGSLSIRIGLPVPPGRGLTVPVYLAYDSNGAVHAVPGANGDALWTSNFSANYGLGSGGWSYTLPTLYWSPYSTGSGSSQCNYITDFVFQDPMGGRHFLGMSALDFGNDCNPDGIPASYGTLGGGDDFYWAVGRMPNAGLVMVTDKVSGTIYTFYTNPGPGMAVPAFIEDSNGNQVTINGDAYNLPITMTDTLGRNLTLSSGNPQTVQVPGPSTFSVAWEPAPGTKPAVGQSDDPQNSNDSQCVGRPIPPFGPNGGLSVVKSVTLPNLQQYQFFYDGTFGLLNEIIYPTGAWVKYTWNWSSRADHIWLPDFQGQVDTCGFTYDVPAVTGRQVSFDGINVALQQTFTYNTNWNYTGYQEPFPSKTTTVMNQDMLATTTTNTKYTYGYMAAPIGPNDNPNFLSYIPVEDSATYTDANGKVYRVVNQTWGDQYLMGCESSTEYSNGVAGPTSRTDYNPGAGYPWTNKKEWDWGQAPACGSTPSGTPRRETDFTLQGFQVQVYPTSYWQYSWMIPEFARPSAVTTNYNGVEAAQTTYEYDAPGSLSPASVTQGRDPQFNGDSITVRGNLTSKTELNLEGTSPEWSYTNDDTGQRLSMTDPCGNLGCADMIGSNHTTNYAYGSGYYNAYLTQIEYPPTNNGFSHTREYTYNLEDGHLATSLDVENDQKTWYYYGQNGDQLDRLTSISYPDGGSTTYSYDNPCGTPSTTTMLLSTSSTYTENSTLDGVCHVTETAIKDPENPSSPIKTDTVYDGFGRVWKVSNPYQGANPNLNTITTYDPLGRVNQVTYPDQSYATTTYGVNCSAQPGFCSTVTDAAGKVRQLWNDGLGRLTGVSEDPNNLNYQTTYSYNGLDDLSTVLQSGQSRSFNYNSLSQLTSATNPESGQVTYTYDASGNVSSKVAPAPNQPPGSTETVTTTNLYDALNRLLCKNYSDTTTVRACYAYDGIGWGSPWNDTMTNAVGHLTASWGVLHNGTVVAANEFYQFDPMGRLQAGRECTPATCGATSGTTSYPIAIGYDLLGNQLNFWDSSIIRYSSYDAANRLSNFTASFGVAEPTEEPPPTGPGTQALLNVTQYGPVGMLNATLGNGLTENRAYNNRTWLGSVSLSNSVYSLGLTYLGNGNVNTANDSVNGNWTYGYDTVNRLQTASGNGQVFSYNINPNPWGNMTCSNTGNLPCTPLGLAFSAANNQITTSGYNYDSAGNLLSDNTHGYVYDAENRIWCVKGSDGTCASASAMLYLYDADGQRVGKQYADTLEDYVYDPQGHITSVHDGQANLLRTELYAGSRHVASWAPTNPTYWDPYPGGLFYNHADWLGTERVRTNSSGAIAETCTDTPYGMNLVCNSPLSIADSTPMHFTGQQLDPETGNDFFKARYFGSGTNLGRFMTPDWSGDPDPVPYADFENPQSLNLYAYVLNNPTTSTDSDGHFHCDPTTYSSSSNGDTYTLTVTAGACHFDWSDLELVLGPTVPAAKYAGEFVSQVGQQLSHIANTPGGGACLAALAGAGAQAGAMTGGEFGFAGGPFAETTVPIGSAGGATAGAIAGVATAMTACPGGAASSGGGGGGGGGNANDNKKADDLIRATLKRSDSYASEYGNKTYGQIKDLAKGGDMKAKGMKKLIEQSVRLMEKVGNK